MLFRSVLWQQLFKADYPDKLKEVLPEADTSTPYAVDGNEPTYFFTGEDNVITSKTIDSKTSDGWLRDKLLIRYVDPDKPMVALTYDDGPGLKSETRIHDVLEKYDGVATFFYAGYMIKGKEYQIKRALGNGCEIGSHTWNHPVLTKCSDKELKKQLNKTNEAIEAACRKRCHDRERRALRSAFFQCRRRSRYIVRYSPARAGAGAARYSA